MKGRAGGAGPINRRNNMSGFFVFLKDNWAHVLPILIVGVFAVAIVIERSIALFKTFPIQDTQAFLDKLTELVMGGKIGEAVALCDKYPSKPAARVSKQALLRAHQPEGLIEHGLEIVT